jgi:flavin-dependent dehydrogenase
MMGDRYDIGIIGGGLAGLSLAIQLVRVGYSVILWEKDDYPAHRVCGEYVSRESIPFLTDLGLDLSALHVAEIQYLELSTPSGKLTRTVLPLGGIGISRYLLDQQLADLATSLGVHVMTHTKVSDVDFQQDHHVVETHAGRFICKVVVGSFGKRSLMDLRMDRAFIQEKKTASHNYVGVKYHIRLPFPRDTIALHHFEKGYCGLSAIEDDMYCLCYMVAASQLRAHGTIHAMEQAVLMKQPFLKTIWEEAVFMWDKPITISQISFDRKTQIEQHVLMVGDAAGMITPLCGNGMSMALHGAKLASMCIRQFLEGAITRVDMEMQYQWVWNTHFSSRLRVGKWLQDLFQSKLAANLLLSSLQSFPRVRQFIIRQTHGEPF